ncbi:hypothetical protein BN1183_CB_00590, partial [Pantoea ananatis]|uniref:hypothetical protein n=1 Tax=Pantoea ananas TaxID=553 RepID=UPI00061CCFB6
FFTCVTGEKRGVRPAVLHGRDRASAFRVIKTAGSGKWRVRKPDGMPRPASYTCTPCPKTTNRLIIVIQQTPSIQKPQVNKSRECLTAIHRIPSLFEIQYDAIAVFLTDSINQATRYLPTILL